MLAADRLDAERREAASAACGSVNAPGWPTGANVVVPHVDACRCGSRSRTAAGRSPCRRWPGPCRSRPGTSPPTWRLGGRRRRHVRVPAADHARLGGEQEQRRPARRRSGPRTRSPPLNTRPVGAPPGMLTTSGTIEAAGVASVAPRYSVDTSMPLSATQAGVVGPERQAPGIDEIGIGQLGRARRVGDEVALVEAVERTAVVVRMRDAAAGGRATTRPTTRVGNHVLVLVNRVVRRRDACRMKASLSLVAWRDSRRWYAAAL